jgi:hypothetical protein
LRGVKDRRFNSKREGSAGDWQGKLSNDRPGFQVVGPAAFEIALFVSSDTQFAGKNVFGGEHLVQFGSPHIDQLL